MTSANYETLFTVELLHKFFTDQLCKDFTVIPSVQTAKILNGHKIIARQYSNQLFAGIQSDLPGKPFIIPEEGMQMTFFLQLNNPLFFNYTNLPSTFSPGKVYYFTNRNPTRSNGKNFLSLNNTYSAAATYKPGDLAVNASGTVFEAIRTNTGMAPPADGVASDFWMQVDEGINPNRYMSEDDALQWFPFRSTYNLTTPQLSVSVQVSGYNTVSSDYTKLVFSKTTSNTKPFSSFTLDLSVLEAGKYILNINGITQNIFLSDEPAIASAFAVIDIFCESSLAATYQILDASDNLKAPLYSVYFLNRSTIWKYIFANGSMGGITDTAKVYQFTPFSPPSNIIFSLKPIPLNEKALNLKLTIGTQNYSPIECASPKRLTSISQSGDAYSCSEIFLNYSS